ncbi:MULTISPECIES: hypothetical protein [Flavobacteriaceae]|uniref:Rieske (2Fe-2S) protein n=1 Tax=Flavobacteriaceae TaxID=49546 RepID=UPI0010ADFB35|nr:MULTISPECIES: hypothetical protein [Flavobacteriaceae]NJB36812.1 hypothetical protein [Croceivirga sp. JEA036]TKD65373.1 hypothetical protein FBT53_07530 [Flavobacterium sp. ASW18X]
MRYFFLLIVTLLLFGCDKNTTNRNPFLQEVGFRFELNLNLPLYSNLNSVGNPIYVGNNGVGTRGAFVMRTGPDTFFAFEASCPNHAPNECSTMTLDGSNVVCSCDDYEYSLFSGSMLNRPDDGQRYYDLLFYNTTVAGSSVIISN